MIENNYLQQADVALQKGIEIKRKKCYNVHSKKMFSAMHNELPNIKRRKQQMKSKGGMRYENEMEGCTLNT